MAMRYIMARTYIVGVSFVLLARNVNTSVFSNVGSGSSSRWFPPWNRSLYWNGGLVGIGG